MSRLRTENHSWINILRRRKRRRLRPRLKRSSTRTIVSLNTKHRRHKSNSRCHKYAMFKVGHTVGFLNLDIKAAITNQYLPFAEGFVSSP